MKLDKRLLGKATLARFFLVLTIGLGFCTGVLVIAQARTLSAIITQVFLRGAALDGVSRLLAALLIIVVARAGLSWGGEVAAFQVAARVKTDLRERLFAHLMSLGPAYLRGERTGELTNTLTEGVEALEAYFSQYLPQLVLAALIPLTVLVFVFPLDFLSGCVLLVTAPLIPLFMILIGSAADALTRKQWKSLSFMSAHFLDVLQGLTTLKMFGRGRAQIETIARISDQFRVTTLGVLRVAFLSAFALEMIATISTALVAVEIGLRVLYGTLPFEQAFFILVLAPDFYLPLRLLGTRFHAGMAGVAAAHRVCEVLEMADRTPPATGGGGQTAVGGRWSVIKFDDVHFAYDDDRSALNGVTFEIRAGQRVALIGATGAGKSTVAGLLLRFHAPQRGSITIDGLPLSALAPQAWREQIAWVPQQPYLFNESVADNVRKARSAATHDDIVNAAKLAHADEFIHALPQGYDTPIGERGARLSGGQVQRLAIARAFLRDAPLLIMDEAASSLDVGHEALLQESLKTLLHGRTALIITHRLSTAQSADQIVVLERGRVAEVGTHTELMQQSGVYHRLVTMGEMSHEPGTMINDQSSMSNDQLSMNDYGSRGTQHAPERSLPVGRATFWRLLQLAAPFKGWMALAVLLGTLTIGSSIGLLAASAYLLASAALRPSIAELSVAIVGVRFFGIARGVFRYLERLISHQVSFHLLARLRVWFYTALEPLAPARLMDYRSGDLLTRSVGDVETLQNFFVRVIMPPVVALAIAIGMGVFFCAFAPPLAIVLLGFMFLAGVVVPLGVQRPGRTTGQRLISTRAALNAQLVDGLQGAADLIALGQAEAHAARIQTLNDELIQAQRRMASIGAWQNSLGTLLTNLAMGAIVMCAIPLVTRAKLSGVDLAVLALATLASFEGVLAVPGAFQYLETHLQAARRLFEMIDVPAPQTRGRFVEIPRLAGSGVSVRIEHLSFRYCAAEPLVLDRVSFEAQPGQLIAIAGPSGAGKSTLINLLLRFWDYIDGSIQLNGVDLRECDPEAVRKLIGVVPQQTHLFNATIRENLRLARPDASDEAMVHAAQLAQLHDFIQSLPQGYDTPIGEQGLRLSGGERQRLAIARAVLKDAPLLILDEATAHLDLATERDLLRGLRPFLAQRTTLMITHRPIGLEDAHAIIVLKQGRVVERKRRP